MKPTGTDIQAWFLGLPLIIVLLIVAIVSLIWYGVRYLNKREKYYQGIMDKKDAAIIDLMEKIMIQEKDLIEVQTRWIDKIEGLEKKIDDWFRR